MSIEALDLLVHHCRIVDIKGKSYRQKAAAEWVSGNGENLPT
jgi:hypothetical protein